MRKKQKESLSAAIAIIQGMVGRDLGISDDCDPAIEFGGDSRRCTGAFSAATNTLRFTAGFSQVTVAHELAHWAQWHIEGETDCLPSSATSNYALQVRHAELQSRITAMMRDSGWEDEIDDILS